MNEKGDAGVRHKAVYTTGEAAQICNLSQQTIIRCFDSGQLEGFRVPGSKFRRIPRDSLITFMRANKIPLDQIEGDKIRVLVVDDDPEIIDLFVDVLDGDDRFEVVTATTGYDAGVLTQQFRPDILVLDYMLPDVNGNVVCTTIRRHAELSHIKILMISGVANASEVRRLTEAGADEFIRKPFNIEQVVDRIVALVRP
ncbi:MAG TPA: response regulator [Phycisphaerae bacterium]|nr:response regulator [Phycisphaerae bacterium]HDZ44751.1 response regulator [Phycisphaerae bacterium]